MLKLKVFLSVSFGPAYVRLLQSNLNWARELPGDLSSALMNHLFLSGESQTWGRLGRGEAESPLMRRDKECWSVSGWLSRRMSVWKVSGCGDGEPVRPPRAG